MSLNGGWQIKIDAQVYKELRRFPKRYAQAIDAVIASLAASPFAGDVEKMKEEENSWRRRIGAYRVFYDIYPKQRLVHVTWVERRTSKTY